VEILKKDGSKVQAETNENQIVFSSLEVGDAIHIRYKLESSYYGVLSKHFWQDFSFNGGYPVKLARYSLLVPSNKKFTYKMYNTALQPVITDISDNYKLHIWETTGDSAIESESSMPPFSDIGKRIIVSSIPDWSYVANWYSDLSNIKTKADFEIKEQVATLLKGKEKLADFEKAKLIYNYIEENFNYSDVPFLHSALTPQRASRTLNSRLGDCKDLSVLFASMAKEAGLDASLVLVDTRDNGDRNLDIPEIGFNHCIAQLKVNDKSYLIELTDNHLPFAALSYTVVNANGLYIPKDGQQTNSASLVKLNTTTRIPNTINRRSVIRFEGSKAEIERVSERTGAETSSTRAGYKNLGKEDQRKALLRSLSDEFNNPLVLKSFEITNLDNLEDTVKFNYDFTVDKYTSEIAGMQIVKLPWSDALASLEFVSLEKRTYPLNLWSYSTTPYDREVMTLNFPKGKKLVEKPKNVSYRCPSLAYSLVYEVKADRLVVTREVKYLKDQVPVAEYDSFKDVVNKFTEADKVQLAFK
jgi:transglutaminase-like putative cysteine protease